MNSLRLILVTGRSTKQGTGISTGKERPEYREATGAIELNPEDMQSSGLDDGSIVRLRTEFGTADVRCRRADIPGGLAFMAFGPACNQLVGGETCASGMPDSKHLQVELTPLNHSQSSSAGPTASTGNGKRWGT
jgi:formylmethanofuran dehydrogenase subunit D